VQITIIPIAGEPLKVMFTIRSVRAEMVGRGDPTRAIELQGTLWRIAMEVQAAGVADDFVRLPALVGAFEIGRQPSRQLEVLARLLSGERVPSIAKSMFISQSTVRNHLSNIFKLVGVHSQAELISLALRNSDALQEAIARMGNASEVG